MIGDDYFQTRQRLKDVVHGVLNLAEKTGAEGLPLRDAKIKKALNDPFLFTVCGEKKAGKSTFFSGLFGAQLSDDDVSQSGDSSRWYLYGQEKREEEVNDLLSHQYRYQEFLKRFNFVDTPGTNASEESQNLVDSLLPISDLVFWVFSLSNPWAAATWTALSRQTDEVLQKSVFVLQQVDQVEHKDVELILGHMRDLSMQRIGKTLRIFPVSGQLASMAKTGKKKDYQRWQKSGYPPLEHAVSDMMNSSLTRKEALFHVRDVTVDVLREIESTIERRRILLHGNEGFLREIEAEVEQAREFHVIEFQGHQKSMRQAFDRQINGAMYLMKSKMSVLASFKSLFVTNHFSKKIEAGLIDLVQESVQEQVTEEALKLVDDCREHWKTVCPRVKLRLTIDLDDFDQVSGGFKKIRAKFVERMAIATQESIVKLRIRSGLDRQLAERLQGLKKWVYMALLSLSVAGLSGFFQVPLYPYISLLFCCGFIVMTVMFMVSSNRSRREIMSTFGERLDDARIPFADGLNSDYKEGVHDFYIAYGGLLGGVRRHIIDAKAELQPNLELWNGLFLDLKGIEQDF